MVLLKYRSRANMASVWRRTAGKTAACDSTSKNDGRNCMDFTRISLAQRASEA
jgi:hypothetical protein